MTFKKHTAVIVIVVALAVVVWGVYRTGSQTAPPASSTTRRAPSDRALVVDQSSLVTAEQLLRLPTTGDERALAEDALRVADNEMDLAFAQAVRRAGNLPRAMTDTAKEADARLQLALRALAADQAQVAALAASPTAAKGTNTGSIDDRLNLIKAQVALDQDEVDDARQDLRRAGGDPQGVMAAMIAEHDAASKSSDSIRVVVTTPPETHGLVRHAQALQALHRKEVQLKLARAQADSLAGAFKQRHDRVDARTAALQRAPAITGLTHDSAAALLASIQARSLDGKIRATLDERVDNQHKLAAIYGDWVAVLDTQERAALNLILRDIELILIILLVAMLLARWIEHSLASSALRAQTLHMVARVAPQLLAALFILFVIFGPPNNLGTILGLVGAGLTVALKDFIVGFMGWFVLMGRDGIRIGDLAEINGVTGEVVEIGLFRTALLETGDWAESGHLTGRRVTFNNSFAIEQHYFNFSTSGHWLWDVVRIVVPAGRDPYVIAAALQKQIEAATGESAREAEAEWSGARRSPRLVRPTTGASVSLRPIAEGIEITVRYVTRVTDRDELRGKLYDTAVVMLGEGTVVDSPGTPTREVAAKP